MDRMALTLVSRPILSVSFSALLPGSSDMTRSRPSHLHSSHHHRVIRALIPYGAQVPHLEKASQAKGHNAARCMSVCECSPPDFDETLLFAMVRASNTGSTILSRSCNFASAVVSGGGYLLELSGGACQVHMGPWAVL